MKGHTLGAMLREECWCHYPLVIPNMSCELPVTAFIDILGGESLPPWASPRPPTSPKAAAAVASGSSPSRCHVCGRRVAGDVVVIFAGSGQQVATV